MPVRIYIITVLGAALLAACGGTESDSASSPAISGQPAGSAGPVAAPAPTSDPASPPVNAGDGGNPPSGDTVLPPSAISGDQSTPRPGADATDLPPIGTAMGTVSPTSFQSVAHDTNGNVLPTGSGKLAFEVVTAGLTRPWGFVPLPDGRMLVNEKAGTMRLVAADGGLSEPLTGVPAVDDLAQGGLLDVVASPTFSTDGQIFFSYSEATEGGTRIAVARALLGNTGLSNLRVIFRQRTSRGDGLHYGTRMVFAPDGNLFVALGERNNRPYAQSLETTLGKVIRIGPDGSIPADNPFINTPGAAPEIFSYGHRSPQGITIDPRTGSLWMSEHGPQGGDEINQVSAGLNYGWAHISHGREYDSGAQVGEGTSAPDVVPPVAYWTPVSIAPSNIVFYTGDKVPALKGKLLLAGMRAEALLALQVVGNAITSEARYATELTERIRDVRVGFDGYPYVITDTGRLLRVTAR